MTRDMIYIQTSVSVGFLLGYTNGTVAEESAMRSTIRLQEYKNNIEMIFGMERYQFI